MNKIYYTKAYKFRLAKEFTVELTNCPPMPAGKIAMPFAHIEARDHAYDLVCERYYGWDGATWALDSKNFRRGSAAHDALLELIGLGLLPANPWKPWADNFLLKLCKEDGMWLPRRKWVYGAVSKLGNPTGSRPRKIHSAP